MTYEEVLANARPEMGKYCKACPVCDGRACKNQIPGPGAKGNGDVAIRNYANIAKELGMELSEEEIAAIPAEKKAWMDERCAVLKARTEEYYRLANLIR